MDNLYKNYMNSNSKFFKYKESENIYFLDQNTYPNYSIYDDKRHWIYFNYINDVLPVQGFKIHISCLAKDSFELFCILSEFLYSKKLSFKVTRSLEEYENKNDKSADRTISGKFITIYPHSESEFIELLEMLHILTKSFDKGPYILTDKRYKNGNVYYRYGGILGIKKIINGRLSYCIMDDRGKYVEDKREPYFYLPNFVKLPNLLKKLDMEYDNDIGKEFFDDIDIYEVLHFSNSGGVYRGFNKKYNRKIILKEARPNTCFDGNKNDAVARLKHEYEMLKVLDKFNLTPQAYNFFQGWENFFLEESFISGTSLWDYVSKKYPFSFERSQDKYLRNAEIILKNLFESIEKLHDNNIAIGDLQPKNIMVLRDLKINFIDLETSVYLDGEFNNNPLRTYGFYTKKTRSLTENDWYAFIKIATFMFLPTFSVDEINTDISRKRLDYIRYIFGKNGVNILENYIQKAIEKAKFNNIDLLNNLSYKSNDIHSFINEKRIGEIIKLLSENIINNINFDSEIIIDADIRAYEYEAGKINILTGGFGILYAFQDRVINEKVYSWIERIDFENYNDLGLFSGLSGIVKVLFDLDLIEKAANLTDIIVSKLYESNEFYDFSILSGLSGIGVFLLSIYNNEVLLNKISQRKLYGAIEKIKNILLKNYKKNKILYNYDNGFIPSGLLNGSAGVLYFLVMYHEKFGDLDIEVLSTFIDKETKHLFINSDGIICLKNKGIMYPYFSGGSLGLLLLLEKVDDIFRKNNIDYYYRLGQNKFIRYEEVKKGILKNLDQRSFLSAGLFKGLAGMIFFTKYIDNISLKNKILKKLLIQLDNFICKEYNDYKVLGNYSYRFSDDFYSGSAGLLFALNSVYSKRNILPIF